LISTSWHQALDEIRTRASIIEAFAEAGVKLKKNGTSFKGVCPFHGDTDPSLQVYPDGHYHCHGCAAHGDVFDVYQFIANTDFRSTVSELASRFAVDLPTTSPETILAEERTRSTVHLFTDIVEIAEKHLWSEKGKKAVAYLHGRGLTDQTIKEARLGFWPNGYASKSLIKAGHHEDQLRDIGFVVDNKEGKAYDLLYKCILFPIMDQRGRIVYLTGRGIEKKMLRKLKGMPAPALYGAEELKGRPDGVVVVEGEIDTLTLRQVGLTAVGLLGANANIEEAARLLGRVKNVVLLLDPDEAGHKGSARLATRLGSGVSMATPAYPPECKDPNDLLQVAGVDGVVAIIGAALEAAVSYLDWAIQCVQDEPDPITRARKLSSDVMPFVARLPDLEQDAVLSRISTDFKLSRTALKADLKKSTQQVVSEQPVGDSVQVPQSWSSVLIAKLQEHYQGLFYQRKTDGTSLYLYSPARNEVVEVSLANPRQVISAMAPELGDVTSWVVAQIPGVEARAASHVLLGSLQRMVQELKSKGGLEVVAEGLHVLGKKKTVILVDRGMKLIREDGKWRPIETPIVDDKFYVTDHNDLASWLPGPWNLDVLNTPTGYTAEEALGLVRDAIERGWEFRDRCDPMIHALLLFALPWVELFPRKPFIHVRAPSGSGKSRLIAGWYAGRIPGMPGGMLPTSYFTTDASSAGLTSLLGNSSITCIFDEFEGSETDARRMAEILRIFRASALGGAGKLRGTRDMGSRQDRLDLPCLAAGIEPIGDRDADANRWFVTELVHVKRRDPPEQVLRRWLADTGVDIEELRRSVLFGLVDKLAETKKAYTDIANDPDLPGRESIDARYLENVYPVLAVAKVLGQDWMALAEQIAQEKRQDYQEVTENRRGNRLLQAVMHAPIEYKRFSGSNEIERTTIAAFLEDGISDRHTFVEYGVVVEDDKMNEGSVLIWVNWNTAHRTILRGTEFDKIIPSRLTKIAQDCDRWVDHSNKRFDGGRGKAPRKATVFRIRMTELADV